jgi:mono/diheme cytochrome c family protein
MRRRAVLMIAAVALFSGCQPGLNRQPRVSKPDMPSTFFADGRSSRPIEPGTVARGQLNLDEPRVTGKSEGQYVFDVPTPLDEAVLARGRERFNAYCSQCHDRTGSGNGKVVSRGLIKPPNFHADLSRGLKLRGQEVKLTDVPAGYIFEVITNGYGAMADHAALVSIDDRWAIIAYVRALQLTTGGAAGGQ